MSLICTGPFGVGGVPEVEDFVLVRGGGIQSSKHLFGCLCKCLALPKEGSVEMTSR